MRMVLVVEDQTQPILSPDGRYRWNGTAWEPTGSPGSWGIARAVALIPLPMIGVTLLPMGEIQKFIGLALLVLISAILVGVDHQQLKKHGVETDGAAAVLVIFLYLVAAPWYLIQRTRRAGSPVYIPVTWFVTFGVYIVVAILSPATWAQADDSPETGASSVEETTSGGSPEIYDPSEARSEDSLAAGADRFSVSEEEMFLWSVRDDRIPVAPDEEAGIVALGEAVCESLDRGVGLLRLSRIITDNGFTSEEAVSIIGSAIWAGCPEYS